jgi:4-hydroxy-tetrahydrodipicolinate synthase
MARMYKDLDNVFGVKEATGNLTQVSDILELCDDGFTLLSGDDFTALPILAIGGKGVISVVSNIAPGPVHELCAAWFAGDTQKAGELHYKLAPLCRACFLETNPVPVKSALGLLGIIEDASSRLPLAPLTPDNARKLEDILRGHARDLCLKP